MPSAAGTTDVTDSADEEVKPLHCVQVAQSMRTICVIRAISGSTIGFPYQSKHPLKNIAVCTSNTAAD
jgi:hypothetical protein